MCSNPETKREGNVVRRGAVELVLMVGFLTGGWEHMRKLKGIRFYKD
jgi:hypothetical protein